MATHTREEIRRPWHGADWVGLGVLATLLIGGLTWSKWVPYWGRAWDLHDGSAWSGGILLEAAGESISLGGAWAFTVSYFGAVWKALLVALLVAATIEALVRRDWLVRMMNRPTALKQSLTGAALSMPSMMCTCCAAPVTAGLRRSGVPTGAALAYWVGNPLLNPAVLVFLLLVLPWQFTLTRVVVGVLIAIGASAVIGKLFPARTTTIEPDENQQPAELSGLLGRYTRSLARISRVMVPEHLATVFVMGLLSPWLAGLYGVEGRIGAVAILLAAVVGTLLVIPTAGEIPIITAVLAAGIGSGTAGALLVALPALSIPSMVMVGKALGWRSTAAMAGAVIVGSMVAGSILAVTM